MIISELAYRKTLSQTTYNDEGSVELINNPKIKVLAARQTGKSHENVGLICQDSYYCKVRKNKSNQFPHVAMAIADGHGDSRHCYSNVGSRIAAKAAVEALLKIYQEVKGDKLAIVSETENRLKTEILVQWRKKVVQDYVEKCPGISNMLNYEAIYQRYGTTLLCGLFAEDMVIIAQIGDGDILAFDQKDLCRRLLITNVGNTGSITDSLCMANADEKFDIKIFKPMKKMSLILSTDGLINSFEGDDEDKAFTDYSRGLVNYLKKSSSVSQGKKEVLSDLKCLTSEGSGDDITVGIISFDFSTQENQ